MLDDIKRTLWAAADKLRANMDAAEYKHLVLGLIFVKYISDTFAARRAELIRRFTDERDEYFLHECDDDMLAEELEDRDYYKEVNVFWVPETARWEALRSAAKQSDIGKRIDDALAIIETENPKLKGILDKRYARAQLPDGKLGELVDLVSTIDVAGSDRASRNLKSEYIVKDGEVLFSWSGSLEVVIWCGGEGALNQHLFKVTSSDYPKWLYFFWTKHHLSHFQQIAASKATTMGHIQRKHLSEAKTVIPTDELIAEASCVFDPLIDRWVTNALKAKTLSNLRDTLLPRLISGQLRLPEAETLIEDAA